MCGIGAIINLGLKVDEIKTLTYSLLTQLESRGHDATGIFIVFKDGRFFLRKMHIPATQFVEYLKEIEKFIPWNKVAYITLHTRLATSGSPLNNENNHPLYEVLKDNLVTVVHNGIVYTQDVELLQHKKREVDSDLLLTGIRKYGKFDINVVKETIEKLYGSIACIYADLKGTIMWYRDSSPLAKAKCSKCIVLASEERMLSNVPQIVGEECEISTVPPYKIFRIQYRNFYYEEITEVYKVRERSEVYYRYAYEVDDETLKRKGRRKRKKKDDEFEFDNDDEFDEFSKNEFIKKTMYYFSDY